MLRHRPHSNHLAGFRNCCHPSRSTETFRVTFPNGGQCCFADSPADQLQRTSGGGTVGGRSPVGREMFPSRSNRRLHLRRDAVDIEICFQSNSVCRESCANRPFEIVVWHPAALGKLCTQLASLTSTDCLRLLCLVGKIDCLVTREVTRRARSPSQSKNPESNITNRDQPSSERNPIVTSSYAQAMPPASGRQARQELVL